MDNMQPAPTSSEVTRSGFVALVGRPNVGKSTLLNRLMGTKVAIVSPKPQTTRTRIQGVVTHADTQIVLVDTPGWGRERGPLGKMLRRHAGEATDGADLVVVMVDAERAPKGVDAIGEELLTRIQRSKSRALILLNKVDRVRDKNELLPMMAAMHALYSWQAIVPVSARSGIGLDELLARIRENLPEGPALFPPDMHTDQMERHLCCELVREQILLRTHDEVPHSSVVVMDVFEDDREQDPPRVRLEGRIYLERDSQKAIVIGRSGAQIKAISEAARHQIEDMLGAKVFLRMTVHVDPQWTTNERQLGHYGLVAAGSGA